ncbi:MAG: IS66 family transposase [Rhodanobacter sp.]
MNSASTDASIDDLATLRRKLAERDAEHRAALAERDTLITQHAATIDSQQRTLVYRQAKIDTLTAEIARLRRWQFGRRSEQLDPGQRALFEDTLAEDIAAVEAQLEALTAPATAPVPPRRPSRREPLPAHLARIEHRHEPASCTCAVCGGALVKIGEDVSERLDCEPVRFFVQRDIYPKYACRPCQRLVAAPVAPAIIERGRPGAGLLAHIAVSKWVDHLPLYRQSAIYTRSGVTLSRGTLAEWAGRIGVALTPLAEAMQAQLLQQSVLHADETPVAMLQPGAGKTKQAYLFAYRSADPQAPAITVFDFCTRRSGEHARRFLGDWQGALMVDDFAGYKAGFAQGITELACLAHIRRKFFELHERQASTLTGPPLASIAQLYRIEADARGLDPPARLALRQTHAKPILDAWWAWIQTVRPTVAGGSGIEKALDYTIRRWPALLRYLDDGRYPIDNNPVENAIRPIALGRRNWLFAGSPSAGQRAAAIMSLLATAKQNGLEPYAWLKDVLTRLPTHPNSRIHELLPHSWQPIA